MPIWLAWDYEVDIFEDDEFVIECANVRRRHRYTCEGEHYEAEYLLTVTGVEANLVYDHTAFNLKEVQDNELELGVVTLRFTDSQRTQLIRRLSWTLEGAKESHHRCTAWGFPGELDTDLRELSRRRLLPTEREQLIKARLGQGNFRAGLLKRWGNACAVTGCRGIETIRASHAKPWRASNDRERLSSANGLPLIANLDALFDAGLIGFTDEGNMLVSQVVHKGDFELLSVPRDLQAKHLPLTVEEKVFLKYHREYVFEARKKSA